MLNQVMIKLCIVMLVESLPTVDFGFDATEL
jgi:hypothetical protein